MFIPELLKAHADYKAGVLDFDAYKAAIDVVMDKIEAQTPEAKAAAFDKMFETVRAGMTEQDEPYDNDKLYYDSDNTHYTWEAQMKAIFGEDFFDFYNKAYSGG